MVWNHNLSTEPFVCLSSTVAVRGAGTGNWSNFLMISLSHSQSQLSTTSLCSNYTSVQWQFTVCHTTHVQCTVLVHYTDRNTSKDTIAALCNISHLQHNAAFSQVFVAQPCRPRMDWVILLMTVPAPRVRVLYPSTTITKHRERNG